MISNVLDVKGLKISFKGESQWLKAVDGVSFSVAKGETLGLVGESGSGKSVTNLGLMGLLVRKPLGGVRVHKLHGEDISGLSERKFRKFVEIE